jgi:hypothetical protein
MKNKVKIFLLATTMALSASISVAQPGVYRGPTTAKDPMYQTDTDTLRAEGLIPPKSHRLLEEMARDNDTTPEELAKAFDLTPDDFEAMLELHGRPKIIPRTAATPDAR